MKDENYDIEKIIRDFSFWVIVGLFIGLNMKSCGVL